MAAKHLIKLILKKIGRTLFGIFITVYLIVALLNTTIGQSILASIVADFFSKAWNTDVRIGALSITPFINAGIKDIYLEDLQKDTLLYANYIEANLFAVPSSKHIVVRNVKIDNLVCHLNEKNKKFNFQFIIDYFSSNKPKKEKPKREPLCLEIRNINLKNINFSLIDYDKKQSVLPGIFSANNMIYQDMSLKAKNFKMKGINFQANIKHLQVKERCGINLKELAGYVHFSDKGLTFYDGIIQTEDSFLALDATMNTSSLKTYKHFVDSVDCTLKIKDKSYVNLKDACYWSEKIQGANQKIYLNCDFIGRVSDLNIKSFDIKTSNTHINISGSIIGLTDFNHTYFNLAVRDITTSLEDYYSMHFGSLLPENKLPDILAKIGNINILGTFRGFVNNFNTSLNIISDLGDLRLEAKAKPCADGQTGYTADLTSTRLNLGTLLDNNMLGGAAFDFKVELIGTNPKKMQGKIDASLRDFYFNNNSYDEINVVGGINGYDISTYLLINDENVNLDGNFSLNYQGKPTFNVDANVAKLNLHRLHFIDFADTNTTITANIKAGVQNFDINRLNGKIALNNIGVKTSTKQYYVNNISLQMENKDSCNNNIVLRSDIIDLDVDGKYTWKSLQNDFAYITNKFIPNFSAVTSLPNNKNKFYYPDEYKAQSDVEFKSNIKDIDLVRSLLNLDLYLPKHINITGHINQQNIFSCNLQASQVEYAGKDFDNLNLDIQTIDKQILLTLDMTNIQISDSLGFKKVAIQVQMDSINADLMARLTKNDDSSTNANIQFHSTIDDKGLQGAFSDTYFNIQGTRINLNDNHIIGIANKNINLMNFMISSANSKITIDGAVSQDDVLYCNFDNVDLSLLNPFIASIGINLTGTLNKDVMFKNILKSPTFTSNLEADNLSVNDVYLGKAWLNIDNAVATDVFNANINMLYIAKNEEIIPLQIVGTISPKEQDNQLDLKLNMKNLQLAIIKNFISSFASDVEGSLSCDNLTIKGKMSSPDIRGVLHTGNVAMRVNMLNTKYWIDDDIAIDNNKIIFKNFVLKDAQNNKITINGNIAHNNFSSFNIDLKAFADKIKILDTKAGGGDIYYGTAYASANMRIFGNTDKINIIGNAKTEPGTSLTVPVSSKETAQENNFITFVSYDTTKNIEASTKNADKSMAYNISIDLNVNPNAKLFIPMDFAQLKGFLTARGNGDLKMDINSDGKFSMIGEVAIDNGTFRFNIMDVMEKEFILQKGGTITWNGEPAGGLLDVMAIYKTKTSLANLLGQNYSQPVDVESIIRLSGAMTNPQPSFDINLPNANEQTVDQLFMNIDRSNEKVMLEQTAGILLTNQFHSSQGGYESDALQSGVASSVMGAALSQLSGVINNMVKVVDVGLNYTNGFDNQLSSAQWGVNLSKSFGKFQLSVNSSFGGITDEYNTSQSTNIIGDMSAKYNYNDNLSFEAFNHSNANDFIKNSISPYTQGGRIIYTRDYDYFKDIFKKKKKTKKNKRQNISAIKNDSTYITQPKNNQVDK